MEDWEYDIEKKYQDLAEQNRETLSAALQGLTTHLKTAWKEHLNEILEEVEEFIQNRREEEAD